MPAFVGKVLAFSLPLARLGAQATLCYHGGQVVPPPFVPAATSMYSPPALVVKPPAPTHYLRGRPHTEVGAGTLTEGRTTAAACQKDYGAFQQESEAAAATELSSATSGFRISRPSQSLLAGLTSAGAAAAMLGSTKRRLNRTRAHQRGPASATLHPTSDGARMPLLTTFAAQSTPSSTSLNKNTDPPRVLNDGVPKFVIAIDVGSMMHKLAVVEYNPRVYTYARSNDSDDETTSASSKDEAVENRELSSSTSKSKKGELQLAGLPEVIYQREELLCWDSGMVHPLFHLGQPTLSKEIMHQSASLIHSLATKALEHLQKHMEKKKIVGKIKGQNGDAHAPPEHYDVHIMARGTSIFRKVGGGSVDAYARVLREVAGVSDFAVLSQQEEAVVGQRGLFLQHVHYRDPLPPAVLDVGGHSIQYTDRYSNTHLYEGGSWEAFGTLMKTVARETLDPTRMLKLDPNPVTQRGFDNFLATMEEKLNQHKPNFPPPAGGQEDRHEDRAGIVVGITAKNSVFHFAALLLRRNDEITADDLYAATVEKVIGKDSKYLGEHGFNEVEKPTPTVSQLGLLIALMRSWNIPRVKWDVVPGLGPGIADVFLQGLELDKAVQNRDSRNAFVRIQRVKNDPLEDAPKES